MLVKKIIKDNIVEIVLFVAVFTLTLFYNIVNTEPDLDNIWNFHMIQKVFLGYIPYKEINILITPLFHFIGSIFMSIFGDNFISFYLIGSTTFASIGVLLYKICKSYTQKSSFILFGISTFLLILTQYIYIPNYNSMIFIFVLALILLQWKQEQFIEKNERASKKNDFIIGIVMSLCFLTKQTVGGFFCFIYVVYLMIYNKKTFGKVDLKLLGMKLLGALSLIIPFLIYLMATESFMDFIDLCFGGIIDFGKKNSTGTLFTWTTFIVVIASAFCFMWFGSKKQEFKSLILGMFTISSLVIAIPLANNYHLYLTLIISVPTLVLILNTLYINIESLKIKKWINISCYIAGLIILIVFTKESINIFKDFESQTLPEELKNYNGLSLDTEYVQDIQNVIEYIKQKESEGYEVYIMSADASFYMIPMQRNNYKFDLMLQGNLGYNGEEKLIKEIEKIENPLFLKTEELVFQESEIIDKYIKENYISGDKIGEHIIYTK